MKARAILNEHMNGGGIALPDLPVELLGMGLVHGFGQQELRAAQAHPHRAIDKAPLIFLLGWHDRPEVWQAPDPPGEAMQAVAHFIQHPQAHWSACWQS